ncbi:hypothetical protein EYF80_050155 [Liparis tanakae]|uniref:Uncharacterized protein n=1 Tax=Liparis tanakae TaxID=230148 RepID=A0A4Z2FEV2_9TELE|nr:hypothetical protein EYF80_050155 [Liparis tanakae]
MAPSLVCCSRREREREREKKGPLRKDSDANGLSALRPVPKWSFVPEHYRPVATRGQSERREAAGWRSGEQTSWDCDKKSFHIRWPHSTLSPFSSLFTPIHSIVKLQMRRAAISDHTLDLLTVPGIKKFDVSGPSGNRYNPHELRPPITNKA